MGKPTGFLEYTRTDNKTEEPLVRIKNFNEFRLQANEEERRKQGARCMNCGVPFCQSALKLKGQTVGCPLHNLIPEWNDEIYNGNYSHAADRLMKSNNFPEFTGRVCPALCEKACINGKYGDPVTVHENELFVIETAFRNGYIKPRTSSVRSDRKVAVIGSGPAGLACADQLNHRGHEVTVYEKADRVGGLLMYGIPNMKLDKSVVDRRVKLMEEEGVRFVTNCRICETDSDATTPDEISVPRLLEEYDAVILCCGAEKPRKLEAWEAEKAEGRDIGGVYYAMDYLTAGTKHLLDGTPAISAEGLNVVIVGGGDTGNDCVGTAIRQGAAAVCQLVRKKELPLERSAKNPWPEWPNVRKTDYGQEEAIAAFGSDPRIYETGVKSLKYETLEDGSYKLTGVETIKVGRKDGKYAELEGTEEIIPADLLIIASGFSGCDEGIAGMFKVEVEKGVVRTEEKKHATNVDKVFTAGDMHRGPSLVVWAIAEGRNCASEVDEYLMGYRALERVL
ncbi:MAG: glutamate synthase subunit beta [Eubacteriales bacterium]|nr:glutamate synthase subunit beta [Eubacteriales bacterium]